MKLKHKLIAMLNDDMLMVIVLSIGVGFLSGMMAQMHREKVHYIVDASEIEVVYNNPYKNLTLDTCNTDYECNIADLLDKQSKESLALVDDQVIYDSTIPIIEPIECDGDTECEKQNTNVGKPAHFPTECEQYFN